LAADFIIDMTDFMIYMQDFRIVSLGSISITLRGNILVDWLNNLIVSTVTALFRDRVTEFISFMIRDFVHATIDEMNRQRFAATNSHAEIQQMLQKVLALEGFGGGNVKRPLE